MRLFAYVNKWICCTDTDTRTTWLLMITGRKVGGEQILYPTRHTLLINGSGIIQPNEISARTSKGRKKRFLATPTVFAKGALAFPQ